MMNDDTVRLDAWVHGLYKALVSAGGLGVEP